jgi:hypothetical protein
MIFSNYLKTKDYLNLVYKNSDIPYINRFMVVEIPDEIIADLTG